MTEYIFIIGFNKTATYSINQFFVANGYASVHWDNGMLALTMQKNLELKKKIMSGYDDKYKVFSDMIFECSHATIEANFWFREMDLHYPDSYFILNNRDTDDWVKSRINHLDGAFLKRQMMSMNKNKEQVIEIWKEKKAKHEGEVRQYFKFNPRFLEIDIAQENVPNAISNLLGVQLNSDYWERLNVSKFKHNER